MKKFIGNTAFKILAVALSFVVFFTMLVSTVGSILMLFGDFYTRDFKTLEQSLMGNLARDEINNLKNKYEQTADFVVSYYADKNVIYDIQNTHTGENVTNYDGQDYIVKYSESDFVTRYISKTDGSIYDSDSVYYNENGIYLSSNLSEELYEMKQNVNFTIYIPQNMQFTDRFFLADKIITLGYNNRGTFIFLAVISLALSIAVFSYLFVSVGRKNNSCDIEISAFNNIPADILTAIVFVIFMIAILCLGDLYGLVNTVTFGTLIIIALYFILLWYLLSVVVQLKAKKLVKHTFLYWLLKKVSKLGGIIRHIYKNFSTVYKVAVIIGAFWAFLLMFMGLNVYETDNLIIGFTIMSAVVTVVILLAAIAFQRVKQCGEKIVNGDLENKVDTSFMFGDIKDFAESLNNINNGLQAALDDKMRSERFKTELITNVSHDIKTPLTSIVNYVDLIKKENCDNKKVNEYIEVLDRQSNRLKKLIEDLVEASKASTGNLSVELTRCNLSLLINQAVGEFSERLEAKNLQIIQLLDDGDIYIMADGRRLWRVFDNLLNNICKYAMNGTRVYIDLSSDNGKAVITFRNISEQPINVSAEELTERFVRGDRSRNTEGSGLGLSIAKSLTELQNGVFEIITDGDLFKARLTFDKLS